MKASLIFRVLGMLAIIFLVGGVIYTGNLALQGI